VVAREAKVVSQALAARAVIDQITQHEQINEVAEAVVGAADRPLAPRVQPLRALEAQRQASDHLRT
jgi:hypothetical protein